MLSCHIINGITLIGLLLFLRFNKISPQIADFRVPETRLCTNPYTFGYDIKQNTDIELIDDDIWPLNQVFSAGGSISSDGFRILFATAKKDSYELIISVYPVLTTVVRECTYEGRVVRRLKSIVEHSPRFEKWPFFDKWVISFQRQEYGISISFNQGYTESLFWKRCLNEPIVSIKVESSDGYLSAEQVDCIVSEWSSWSQCSSSCQIGTRSRTRLILRPASFEGTTCPNLIENEGCNTSISCDDCTYSSWSSWGDCSVTCQGGFRSRTRKLIWKSDIKGRCEDNQTDIESCNEQSCPINCRLSNWTSWSICSSTCGKGTKMRYRIILAQSELGGVQCPSENEITERASCQLQECEKSCSTAEICNNGGTCIDIPNSGFSCECTEDYFGKFCEHKKYSWWVYFVVCIATQIVIGAIVKSTFLSRPAPITETPVTYNQEYAFNQYAPAFDQNVDISGVF
ncbi:extracellular protein with 3 TSP1 domains and an EGF domain [Cryptosporidium sp. chipmunk genotype I]|uniref:extracellular protein with 3 TSP1 domains and an EGF domain n=1 Tax=Cryptosporidium sp. chipmunk genotype I TaxID=1280935 RepID=UPI003519E9EF|nr:extracellular protein with 3 TSP1 domains and an EGF domain [Cryptosporidium sp. chipmunk genotype I]